MTILAPQFDGVLHGNMRSSVVQQILIAIFRGEIPPGSRLVIQKLAEQFQVSPTPIRESLVELESIGVISIRPNKGAVVNPFGRQQLLEIYQIRRVLEVEAVRCTCQNIPEAELTQLKSELEVLLSRKRTNGWASKMMQQDRQLHSLIADHCGSARLQDEIARYAVLIQSLRDIVDWNVSALELAAEQHLAIIEAILNHRPAQAVKAMEQHINTTAKIISEELFKSSSH